MDGLEWERPSKEQIIAFKQKVEMESPPRVTLRMEKGHDIEAACGQLRLREKNRNPKDDTEENRIES